ILLSKWAVRPIEEAWNGQRKFLDDASHELKTPLAVILTNSELACSDDYSAEEKRRFVENIHTMSSHMKVLVEQMLELSRTDRPVSKPVEQIVDFSGIVNHIVLTLEAMLFEKGHPLACEISPDILVKGNEQQLSQVVEILLDNAGKYASENGGIQVFLNRQGNRHCVLTVRNEGQEIPEEELKNLFKRFYRMDSSRTRDGSFGLGLSIAENIVNSHRGKIRAESKDGWNSFYVSIPAADK
ncbi:MAG: HAMP domain-containing histidine kinase, partial [Blautia sp.]|nr:HAMP domain-containing histidine kinase [Blautia sp.]